ncbi:MAG: BCCT family transporter [Phycisphaeraceae bacterium]
MALNRTVFGVSATLITIFVALGFFFPLELHRYLTGMRDWITMNLGWFYIVCVGGFLLFVLLLLVSPFGSTKLGKDDDQPEFSNFTWFAMLFSAGMGIGLLFFSVAEPIAHFNAPPRTGESGSIEAARDAMTLTFFHWGLHAWAIYIIVGLSLAYFSFRHNLPLTIRSTLWPLLGNRVNGPIGYTVEILAVFGTLFGVATSLGLGVMQIAGGLDHLGWFEDGRVLQVTLIVIITLIATASVVSGLHVGIRRLSEVNLLLGLALVVFVLLVGPTVMLFGAFIQNIGLYVVSVFELTFRTEALRGAELFAEVEGDAARGQTWAEGWTMFYWAWWISWSPFVGMFIARISRGRTIREFIGGVLLVPTLLTFAWLTIFGNTGLYQELVGGGGVAGLVGSTTETMLFVMIGNLPVWEWVVLLASIVAMVVIATYFVTSSDSASLVIDILCSNGNPDPPIVTRIFWALTEGAVAMVLLLTGHALVRAYPDDETITAQHGLEALQAGSIITALPVCVIMLFMCASLYKGLRREARKAAERGELIEEGVAEPVEALAAGVPEDWREHLGAIAEAPGGVATRPQLDMPDTREHIRQFIANTVIPAFQEIERELEKHGRDVRIEKRADQAALTVYHQGEEEFSYAVRGRAYHKLAFAFPHMGLDDKARIVRGEVVLPSGHPHGYELQHFTREGIIRDFLDEYARWRQA